MRIGIGDDGAVVAPAPGCDLVFSVDMLVEGRHFLADVDPVTLGHKTLAVNLSDMAAMGATAALGTAGRRASRRRTSAGSTRFTHGLFALADRFGVELIGGDTTRGPRNLCLTIIGEVPAGTALMRGGAAAGDDVYVSGTLGDAALALAVLQGTAQLADGRLRDGARTRLETPEPRVALGERLRGVAHAAIDVSDGLTGDLQHILDSSDVGATIDLLADSALAPASTRMLAGESRDLGLACVLGGGDDYELCFTAATASREAIAAIARDVGVPLARIGSITPARDLSCATSGASRCRCCRESFDHFG